MNTMMQRRPAADEYAEYYGSYISLVPDVDITGALDEQIAEFRSVLDPIDAAETDKLHGDYSWTIKQVVGHLTDVERVFGTRALRFASADSCPLPGIEQNDYVDNTDYQRPTLAQLTDELEYLRRSNVCFFRRIANDAWERRGTADGHHISVRAIAYVLVGHVTHHLDIIRQRIA